MHVGSDNHVIALDMVVIALTYHILPLFSLHKIAHTKIHVSHTRMLTIDTI